MIFNTRVLSFMSTFSLVLFFSACQVGTSTEHKRLSVFDEVSLPYSLREESYYEGNETCRFAVSDVDEDNRDEFLIIQDRCGGIEKKYCFIYFDEKFDKAEWTHHNKSKIELVICANIDRKGTQEIIYTEREENAYFINVLDSEIMKLRNRFKVVEGVDTDGNGMWDGRLGVENCLDVNGDGNLDLIATIRTAFDVGLRGLYAFDLKYGKLIWNYEVGPLIDKVRFQDMDGDKIPELICSTHAPGNGNKANNTDDSHSYIIVIDKNGELLWLHEMGGIFSRTYVCADDMDGDGEKELISTTYSHSADFNEPNTITVWRWQERKKIKKKAIYANFISVDAEDIDGDGQSEIFVGTLNKGLLMFNTQLNEIAHLDYPGSVHTIAIDDINADGEKEMVIGNEERTILILNRKLQPLARHDKVNGFWLSRQGYGQPKKILLSSEGYFRLLTLEKKVLPPIPWGYLFAGFFGGIFLFVIGFFAVRMLKPPSLVTRLKKDLLDDITIGLLSIDKDGKISLLNEQGKRILRLKGRSPIGQAYQNVFENDELRELRELINRSYDTSGENKREEIKLRIGAEGREVLAEVLPLIDAKNKDLGRLIIIEDITEWSQSKRAMAWISMARLLAHEIKNPLANIMITLQCLQREYQKDGVNRSEAYDELVTSSIDEIMRLRNVANGFMRFAKLEKPNLQPHHINRIIDETLDEYSNRISRTIHVKAVLAENVPPVMVDEKQIRAMLANLIENSVNAMPEGGALTVSTALVQKFPEGRNKTDRDFVSIEIADTGVGISDEDLQKVFHPYFSKSKEGVGLGLVIVNRIIEDHNGSIDINSREGIGTTVTVELPVNG